jgi:tetratricopeptide (TPR) repeat protein
MLQPRTRGSLPGLSPRFIQVCRSTRTVGNNRARDNRAVASPTVAQFQGTADMPATFDLIISADAANHAAEFELRDAHGSQLAYRHVDFTTIAFSRRLGLFDLRNYVRNYVDAGKEAAAVAEIGVCIAEEVLGEELFLKLWTPKSQRTLRVQLPGATAEENQLAAALARVPWEIARPAVDKDTLEQRSLLVRIVHDSAEPANEPLALDKDEPLRVLFVFAEAPGSRPLGARRERHELLRLLQREVYPRRRVVAHVLSHGVTRERLQAQIQENSGYHIVHWSGHGHMNSLELAKPGGAKDRLSGHELLGIFLDAGGFIPGLFFLSACHSGEILRIRDWKDFLTAADASESTAKDAAPATETKDIPLEQEPGYTGTAHALLTGGVPSVVAMRYSVGDDYARGLGVEFYRALLAHEQPKPVAVALTMARQAMRDPNKHEQARFAACDHATPVLYGAERPGLIVPQGRSSALDTRDPRLHRIAELTTAEHTHFVGRTWELAGLGADFIGASHSTEAKPVAVITGLGGMGKTALAAEALALWQTRFQWVLIYQAKPNALPFESTLIDIHLKLMGELQRYHNHVRLNPADAIHRAATTEFTGPARLDRLISNLIRALKDEPILLVFDNLETNLKPNPVATPQASEPVWAFQDHAWDECFKRLAIELAGAPSRVLITCRRPLAALVGTPFHGTGLGPLPPGEAALYLREHTGLSRMVFGTDAAERELAKRLLNASRFHPLLMDRLARLATGEAALRPRLLEALETLEKRSDFSSLPALFETGYGDSRELAYLNDALAVSIDQLIESANPPGRRLLWIIALANDPETLDLVRSVWSGETPGGTPPFRPDPLPLLRYLVSVGLATEERSQPNDANPNLTCHEMVRERIRAWMDKRPQDRTDFTESSIRTAYAEWMEALFHTLEGEDQNAALETGRRAIVYYVEAEEYERLGRFALNVVVTASNPHLLNALLPHLRAAAHSVPPGRNRWLCLLILADAMDNAGLTNESLPFYQEAAALAKSAAEGGGEGALQASWDYSAIAGNWAVALRHVSELDASRRLRNERTLTLRKLGAPADDITSSELEALRLDVEEGKVVEALPEIEKRVAKMEDWWLRTLAGARVPEAPNPTHLAHLFVNALDLDRVARLAIEDWVLALRRTDEILRLKSALKHPIEDIAIYLRNRAVVLTRLERYPEAKETLEACLQAFANDPVNRARTLNALADLLDEQDDIPQAVIQMRRALSLFDTLPSPDDRSAAHSNLAIYLERSSEPSARAEAYSHRLAGLAYALAAQHGIRLQESFSGYCLQFGRAKTDAASVAPRLADLLVDPAFHALNEWLQDRKVDLSQLQTEIDRFVEDARLHVAHEQGD